MEAYELHIRLEIEDEMHIWTLSTCKYMCICKQHIWHSCIYVCVCTYTHKYGVYMSFQTYTYTAVVVLRIGWSNQLLTDRQTGLLPLAGCPN